MDYGDWRLGAPQLDPQVQALAQALRAPNVEAPDTSKGYWQQTWPGAETVDLKTVDQSPWGNGVQGWTVCDKDKRACTILMLRNAANRECVEKHERQHAAGYDHPDYSEAFICPR